MFLSLRTIDENSVGYRSEQRHWARGRASACAERVSCFVGARKREAGRKAADQIAGEGGKATFLELDVADAASVTAAARQFERITDHLDALVNNAGIIVDGDDSILEISDDQMRQTLETNTLGALRVTRAFLPFLKRVKPHGSSMFPAAADN